MKVITSCKRTSCGSTRRTTVTRVTKNLVTWGLGVANLARPVANLVGEHNSLQENRVANVENLLYTY